MSASHFDQFKQLLTQAIQDTDFVRKNSVLQDSAFQNLVLSRIESLTDDVVISQDYSDVISSMGMLYQDIPNKRLAFNMEGYDAPLFKNFEGNIVNANRIFIRTSDTDNVRYMISDGGPLGTSGSTTGVMLFTRDLELIRRFPNFGSDIANGQYQNASNAISFTINDEEYVAIAEYEAHVVQIYKYDGTYVSTIGQVGVPDADFSHLTKPIGLAVISNTLYIACEEGQPTSATADAGFVAVWDLTIPATPTFVDIPMYYGSTGSLLDGQVNNPVDLFYDGAYLWVTNNGDNTVGAFEVATSTFTCSGVLESKGVGYSLQGPEQIFVSNLTGGYKKVYVANYSKGSVEIFDGKTFKHLESYGTRFSDINTYTDYMPQIFGALGGPRGVIVDTINVNDQDINILIVVDSDRVARFNLDAYSNQNFVNFDMLEFAVPVIINGWTINGNIPLDLIKVQYRTSFSDAFQELNPADLTQASRTFQFRLSASFKDFKIVDKNWYISKLLVFGKMA